MVERIERIEQSERIESFESIDSIDSFDKGDKGDKVTDKARDKVGQLGIPFALVTFGARNDFIV